MLDPFIALPMIKQIGYNSIEICLSDDWPTYPEKFSLEEQERLKDLCQELGFSSPAFFGLIDVCNLDNPKELKKTLEKFRIGKKTNIELPGESRGIFKYKNNAPNRFCTSQPGEGETES